MAEHGAKQVLDIVGVQPGVGGLGAAGGDEILFAGGVKRGQLVLLLDLGDLLDDLDSLGQELHQLSVNGVNLPAQFLKLGFVAGRRGGAGFSGRARLCGRLTHSTGVVGVLERSSGGG